MVHEKKGRAYDTNEQIPSRDKHGMQAATANVEPKKRKKVHDRRKRRRGVAAPVATAISSPVKNSEPESKDTRKAKTKDKVATPVEEHPSKRTRLTETSKSKTSDTNKPKGRRIISLSGISKSSSRQRPSILVGPLTTRYMTWNLTSFTRISNALFFTHCNRLAHKHATKFTILNARATQDGALSVSRGASPRSPRTPRGGIDAMHARLVGH